MNSERVCSKCTYISVSPYESPCLGCIGTEYHPNYKPKQVYISTADNRKNDPLERMILKYMDVNSLYPTLKYKPIKFDLKELDQLMEMKTRWTIDRPLNPLYGITQYIDKDVKITSDVLKRMEAEMEKEMREPKKVIFNDPATIVFWHDGTKTVVKAIDEPFDPEKGLAMAIAKKYLGNEGNYYNTFKKWLPEERTAVEIPLSAENRTLLEYLHEQGAIYVNVDQLKELYI